MPINQLSLLKTRRFLPLFLTQFLGAFNDNLYKNALAILITYTLVSQIRFNPGFLIGIAAFVFILPFFLFSALAGQLADKFEKSRLIRYTKIAEIMLMLIAGLGFALHSIAMLIGVLFLLGLQATFFGPVKYSILPDHLKPEELIAGNALMESGTFFAILLGTIIGSFLAALHIGVGAISVASLALIVSIAGYIASLGIPKTSIAAPNLKLNFNLLKETFSIVSSTCKNRNLYLSILGISWFWLIGMTYLTQFPTYAKDVLGAQPSVVTLFLIFFTAGIALGSLICNKLLRSKIDATYVPLAALGMTLFAIDLVLASEHIRTSTGELASLLGFLSHLRNWRILLDLLFLSTCGGIYIVPLYSILQNESQPEFRSRAIASNNIINALFMSVAAIATSIFLFFHVSITAVFLIVAIANLFVTIHICNLLPEELVKSFLIWVFKFFYRVEIRGLENYYAAGNRVLIVANHTSFLDAALLAAFLPDRLTFAIDTHVAQRWWIKVMLKLVNTYSLDPTNPLATKSLIEYLRQNHRTVIFPEGRITTTGSLMKIYEGPGLIADKADAKLLPVRIDGAQFTPFSYLRGKVNIRWFPKITLTILEPRTIDLPASMTGRQRRQHVSAKLYDIMSDTMFLSSKSEQTLFEALLNTAAIHGKRHIALEDIERKPMNYKTLILASLVLGRMIAKNTEPNSNVGILLPNSIAYVVTFFGMQAFHRVPALLNFTTGIQNLLSACRTAKLKVVYTSRKFIDVANLHDIVKAITMEGISVVYLEDVKKKIGIGRKLRGKFASLFPRYYYHYVNHINKENALEQAHSPAVILFTSGSEGTPKGVALSHTNLQSNRYQANARVDFNPSDRVFNALPMFHSFGLNGATLLPLLSGIKVFLYPSPLHYRIVPELCYDSNATIFFGTDTFLANYAKYAHPYNFYSLRYVFAGAEKLRDETRKVWMQKFGIRIMEGYGVTECAPVLSLNTPMQYKMGTVGRLMPGISHKLVPVEGINEGQRLLVSGPNIMLGYMFANNPGKIIPLVDGWYDTGDIVHIDEEGYITIRGRAKRFAKIAGEMVSLTAVEEEVYTLWPQGQHAILSRADERKGEQIVLITNHKTAEIVALISHFKQRGIGEINLPRKIIKLDELPLLGSGKVDYQAAKVIVEEDKSATSDVGDVDDEMEEDKAS